MELIMASDEASKWIICRPGIEAVFADLRHLSQLFIKISKYDTHRLALHYGNLMRECIQHQSISKHSDFDDLAGSLESHIRKFFDYTTRYSDFYVSSNATTFRVDLCVCFGVSARHCISHSFDFL
ncbi:uncharacterized protein LOC141642895 [Silene latifolia]|uniref:uncharacterized protein LOC141642895 n=1 Tax=Silene latifolia TaxID=37657 RepID=UPI003D776EC7